MQDENITEEDVIEIMDQVIKVPNIILKGMVSRNINIVKKFENQILDYKSTLQNDELLKIRKVIETPVSELQKILLNVYKTTNKKQLKTLADPQSKHFIETNLNYLDMIYFNKK
ncbi:MAG: hypothetical protein PHY59_09510 [Methanobacterium sp.]|nr:hypothetical protein [Methanobacterium sp.]